MAEPTSTYSQQYTGMDDYYRKKQYKDVPPYVGVTPEMQAAYDAFKNQIGIPAGYTNAMDAARDILGRPGTLEQLGLNPGMFARNAAKFISRGGAGIDAATQAAIKANQSIGRDVWGEMTGGIGVKGNIGSTANDPRFIRAAQDYMNTQAGVRAAGEQAKEQVRMNRLGLVADVGGAMSGIIQKDTTTGLLAQQGIAELELKAHQQQMNDLIASYGMQFQLSQLPQDQMNKIAAWWAAMGGGPSDLDAIIQAAGTVTDLLLAYYSMGAGGGGGGFPTGGVA